ncbi:MAG: glycerol-3-phosphate 1-O-acyltransferase PlsY [Armatimonadetes bacterium]|nr:glycerol-3-phosphate 1-O-acyltransferase PlsY [Armatimonadota bacterium]
MCLYVASYLLGGVPFGYLIAKSQGVDLTKVGSGNIGATNVLRVLGPKAGIPAFLLDVAKGALPPVLVRLLWHSSEPGDLANHCVLLGVAAVLGHSFSPFLRFKGGKSVATGLGALLGTAPIVGLIGFGVFVVLYVATQYVSLSSLLACGSVMAAAFLTGQNPLFKVVYGLVCLFVAWRHKGNIQRLMKGEEPKTPLFKKKPPRDGGEGN